MTLELSVLGGAAALLLAAMRVRRESVLLAGVLAYAGATIWLLHRNVEWVLPALGVAIVLGLAGIVLALRIGDSETLGVTRRHRKSVIITNKMAELESIGP
jgi:hypothetical protein